MVIAVMKGYIIFVIILMLLYTVRHFYFTVVRLLGKQRLYYNDIVTSRMKSISVLIPMHNEEQVLMNVLDSLLECDYDRDRLEIIPINDNSTDRTKKCWTNITENMSSYDRFTETVRTEENLWDSMMPCSWREAKSSSYLMRITGLPKIC